MPAVFPMSVVYEAAVSGLSPHASDPRVFDAVFVSTTSGVAAITVVPQQGSAEVSIANVSNGTVLPIKTRLITGLTGTGAAFVGLGSPVVASWFNSVSAVTPSNTDDNIFDGIWVNALGGGTVVEVVPLHSSEAVSFTVTNGLFIPIRTKKVTENTNVTVRGFRF